VLVYKGDEIRCHFLLPGNFGMARASLEGKEMSEYFRVV
jgi:hypothetical protein